MYQMSIMAQPFQTSIAKSVDLTHTQKLVLEWRIAKHL